MVRTSGWPWRSLAILLVAALVVGAAPEAWSSGLEHDYRPIQPGAQVGGCTLNFVLTDAEGELYVGTAGHCSVGAVGTRPVVPGIGAFGTVVYSNYTGTGQFPVPPDVPQMDFKLIHIDADKHDQVNPAYRYWGGPGGVATQLAAGDSVYQYGQAIYYNSLEPTRAKTGIAHGIQEGGIWDGWWFASFPTLGGDSGSGVLAPDGRALGIVSILGPTTPASGGMGSVVAGPTLDLILRHMDQVGYALELVTAPFLGPLTSEATFARLEATLARCQGQTVSGYADPDGCIRPKDYPYRAIGTTHPHLTWSLFPWVAMANVWGPMCYPLFFYPNLYLRWCDESVLIVMDDSPDDTPRDLTVTVTWPDPADELEIHLLDEEHQSLAVSQRTGAAPEAVLHALAIDPGSYLLVIIPRSYIGPNFLELGGEQPIVEVSLTTPPAPLRG